MTSPCEFCRDGEFPIAVFLTYSFDPLFFERIPRGDVLIGGSRRIIVAADAGQVAEAMRRCAGQIFHLGRNYALAETVLTNTFHPKLIARLSAKGGRVWVGSGNLTYTGWGGNSELATSWSIGPGEEDKGAWLDDLLDVVSDSVRSTTFADQIRAVRGEAIWLTSRPASPSPAPVLVGHRGEPLAPQVAARWRERRFTDVKILTGSTDEGGAFLRWAQQTFGVERASICVTPEYASFTAEALGKLSVKVGIIPAGSDKAMHAKFYWFSGPDGPACLVGSANCSAAAWLADGAGANVELMAVYDEPQAKDFGAILSKFDAKVIPPKEAFANAKAKPPEDESSSAPRYRLVSLRLRSHRIVEALIDPSPPAAAEVTLRVRNDQRDLRLTLVRQAQHYAGEVPTEFSYGSVTLFAVAQIRLQKISFVTDLRWIDSDALLSRASAVRTLEKSLEDISSRVIFGADRVRIMEAVHAVVAHLLTPTQQVFASGPTPSARARFGADRTESQPDTWAEERQPIPAVDPVAMVRSLHDLDSRIRSEFGPISPFFSGPLDGVMKLLFAQEEPTKEVDLSREAKSDDGPNAPDQPTNKSIPGESVQGHADDQAFLNKFRAQLRDYLTQLESKSFADTCSSEKLVHALAFPLAVCLRGQACGWLPANELASVAPRVVDVMFGQRNGDRSSHGLVDAVRNRYIGLDRESEFCTGVGRGPLWTVLLAALTSRANGTIQASVLMASALTTVLGNRDLLSYATEVDIWSLMKSIGIEGVTENLTTKAEAMVEASASLTRALTAYWDSCPESLRHGMRLCAARSVLWSKTWGWKVAPPSPAQTYVTGYLDVATTARTQPDIKQALDRLCSVCAA